MPRSPTGAQRLSSYEEAWEAIGRLIRQGGSWSGFERNCFYLNAGDGTFANVSAASGLDFIEDGRAFSVLDLDVDGDPDLILKNRSSPQLRILRNDLPGRGGRAAFLLTGRKANRDAVGARVTVRAGGKVRTKSVKCGSGFLSQNSPWLSFAFPGADRLDVVELQWPGGGRQEFRGLATGRRYRIAEGETPASEPFQLPSRRGAGEAAADSKPVAQIARGDRREVWLLAELAPPDVEFQGAGGRAFRISELRGRTVLLCFFSAECAACRGELREWGESRRDIAASGLSMVLVEPAVEDGAPDESQGEARRQIRALEEAGGFFRSVRAEARVLAAYGVLLHQAARWPQQMSVPTHLLLDASGRVVKLYRGSVKWAGLARDLALLVQASRPDRLGLPFPGVFYTGDPRRDYFQLGLGYVEIGLHDLARSAFRRAVEMRPDHGEALFNLGVVAGEAAGWSKPQADPELLAEARGWFEKAAALQPEFADAHTNLGVVLARLGKLDAAEERFAEALRLRPGDAQALLNRGSVCLARGQDDRALEAFEAAAASDPDLPAIHKRLGEVQRRLGRPREALASFQRAVELDPGDAEARSNCGVLLAERGRFEDAAAELGEALRLQPAHAGAWNNLALVEERLGRHADAEASFRKAIEADPKMAEPYMNLARSLHRRDRGREAAALLRALLRERPGHPEAEKLLRSLRR